VLVQQLDEVHIECVELMGLHSNLPSRRP